MRRLDIDILNEGLPGISKAVGAFLREAAIICLEGNGHTSGALLEVTGDYQEKYELLWTPLSSSEQESWGDEKEATEYGATALAILLIKNLTRFGFFQRSPQKNLADFTVETLDGIIELAYLEISGIWKETPNNSINMRINAKKKQVAEKNKDKESMVFVIVAEFSSPKAKIIKP